MKKYYAILILALSSIFVFSLLADGQEEDFRRDADERAHHEREMREREYREREMREREHREMEMREREHHEREMREREHHQRNDFEVESLGKSVILYFELVPVESEEDEFFVTVATNYFSYRVEGEGFENEEHFQFVLEGQLKFVDDDLQELAVLFETELSYGDDESNFHVASRGSVIAELGEDVKLVKLGDKTLMLKVVEQE